MRTFAILALLIFVIQIPTLSWAKDDPNANLRAIAQGCGSKIYTGEGARHDQAVEELNQCYQTAMKETMSEQLTPLGLAFKMCSSFSVEVQQYFCIEKYKDEAHDSNLYKLFGDCLNTEKELKLKTKMTYACLKEKKKDEKKYPPSNKEEIILEKKQLDFLAQVKSLCGAKDAVAGYSDAEVENVADCNQTALLLIAKQKQSAYQTTITLCEVFNDRIGRLGCYRRGAAIIKNTKLDLGIQGCTARPANKKKLTAAQAFKKIKYKEGAGYELSQKEYGVKTDCIKEVFASLDQQTAPVTKATPSEASQARP